MLGEHCMTNMHITYEHQLIIINHFQNEQNFAGMMYAFVLFINKVDNKAKKQKGSALHLLQLHTFIDATLEKSS